MQTPEQLRERVVHLRALLAHGERCDEHQLSAILEELEPYRRVLQAEERAEPLALVDSKGVTLPLAAPRWACHVLGLRHRAVHVLLEWRTAGLGRVFLLQVRSWSKVEHPGHLDLSATGHVQLRDATSPTAAAYRELREELGVSDSALAQPGLRHILGYNSVNEIPERGFINAEWRDIFVGTLTDPGFETVKFSDREVAGVLLFPVDDASGLLAQDRLPLADALVNSLPRLLHGYQVS